MSKLRSLVPDLPRDAWIVLAADALWAVGSGLTLPFLLIYLHRIRGIELSVAGLAVSMVVAGSVFGNLAAGPLGDRLGARRALMIGLLIASAGAICVTLIREPWHAFAAAGAVGVGAGVIWPAQDALLGSVVSAAKRSSAYSVRLGDHECRSRSRRVDSSSDRRPVLPDEFRGALRSRRRSPSCWPSRCFSRSAP
jgi:MFS family permease